MENSIVGEIELSEVASQRIREALGDIEDGRVFTVEAGLKELRQLREIPMPVSLCPICKCYEHLLVELKVRCACGNCDTCRNCGRLKEEEETFCSHCKEIYEDFSD